MNPDNLQPGVNTPLARGIVVAIDFSEFSKSALDYGVALAVKFGCKITLIHVVEPTVNPQTLAITTEAEIDMRIVREKQEMLDSLRRDGINPGIPSEAIIKTGEPSEQIIEEARFLGSELIITASHGHSALQDVLLGNTAERVVSHAGCSVLTVRQGKLFNPLGPTGFRGFRKILVPIDFSTASEQALVKGANLAKAFGAEIVLEHVLETNPLQIGGETRLEKLKANAESVLANLGRQQIPPEITHHVVVTIGAPFEAITKTAETTRADLIIITAHLKHTMLGTCAERVVRHSPCAVWTLRE